MLKLFDIVRSDRGYLGGNPLEVLRLPLLHLHTCNCIYHAVSAFFIITFIYHQIIYFDLMLGFLSRLQCFFILFYSDAFISILSFFPHPFFSSFLPSCDISREYYLSYYLSVLALHLLSFELFNFFVEKSMLCKNYYFYFIYSIIYLLVCLFVC